MLQIVILSERTTIRDLLARKVRALSGLLLLAELGNPPQTFLDLVESAEWFKESYGSSIVKRQGYQCRPVIEHDLVCLITINHTHWQ